MTPQMPARSLCRLIDRARVALTLLALTLGANFGQEARAQGTVQAVDIALVLAVDVSGSINSGRFTLQMEGIAKAFDGRGNYTLGLKEQLIFPEIQYDSVASIHGMDITFVTTAKTNEEGKALLRQMGIPFRT